MFASFPHIQPAAFFLSVPVLPKGRGKNASPVAVSTSNMALRPWKDRSFQSLSGQRRLLAGAMLFRVRQRVTLEQGREDRTYSVSD